MSANLPTDRETGRPRGFAFVEFATEAEAAEAVRMFNGRELGGRKLNVNAADDRPRRSEGPRPYRPSAPPMGSDDFGGGGFGGGGFGGGGGGGRPAQGQGRRFKSKGSRRGLRRRKRSL